VTVQLGPIKTKVLNILKYYSKINVNNRLKIVLESNSVKTRPCKNKSFKYHSNEPELTSKKLPHENAIKHERRGLL
jgi:hypothetical protein